MTNDPNWLLSTLAQSTAALVGIVGGFFVSRLVMIYSEISRLSSVISELKVRQAVLDREYEPIRKKFESESQERYEVFNLGELIHSHKNGTEPNIDIPVGITREEEEDIYEFYKSEIQLAFAVLEHDFPGTSDIPEDFVRNINPGKIRNSRIWEKVRRSINADRNKLRPKTLFSNFANLSNQNFDATSLSLSARTDGYLRNVEKMQKLNLERTEMAAQIKMNEFKKSDTQVIAPLQSTLRFLIIFAVLGMVYPMSLLLVQPNFHSIIWRSSALLAFLVGFVILLFHLYKEVKKINPEKQPKNLE